MNTKIIECPECDGHGDYAYVDYDGFGEPTRRVARCSACLGTGTARQLTDDDDDDDDIRGTAGFDSFDDDDDDWGQP